MMKPARCFLGDDFANRLKSNVSWKRKGVSIRRPMIKMQDKADLFIFQLLFH